MPRFLLAACFCLALVGLPSHAGEVYFTDFSSFTAGFDTIAGTDGWTGSASHSGLKFSGVDAEGTHGISGIGNAAFIGGNSMVLNPSISRTVNVRRAMTKDPVALGQEVVLFYVNLGIKDSTASGISVKRDNFEFAFYNQTGQLLAFLQFDNSTLSSAGGDPVRRILRSSWSGTQFAKVETGATFFHDVLMGLQIRINFRTNRWSAVLDDVELFSDEVFYAGNVTKNLGLVAAQLQIVGTGTVSGTFQQGPAPGDNYMLFDDFALRMDAVSPPVILSQERIRETGAFKLSWLTEALYRYQVQYVDDIGEAWKSDLAGSALTATATGTSPVFTDNTSSGKTRRYYRVVRMYP